VFREGSAWTALGFVLGVSAGGALAARLRGKSVLAGRRCAACGASLSLWPRLPPLSWLATRPQCPRCGNEAPRLHAALEAAVALTGVAALLLAPPRIAVPGAVAAWLLLLLVLARRRR
jgi:prepilin signal peptidase PulO-like enzyme (type II secretory pathway)